MPNPPHRTDAPETAMPRPAASRPALAASAAVLALALLAAPTARAQQPGVDDGAPRPRTPASWAAGLRLGAFDMTNAADSYDAVYGDPLILYGLSLETQWRRLRFGLSVDHGSVSGERVLLTSGGPRGTGVGQDLTLTPIHLTAAWRFNPGARWEWSAGLGPSWLSWKDEGGGDSTSGSEVGGSAVVELRRTRGGLNAPGWEWGAELRWSTFPGALPDDGGVTAFYGEDDPGGLALTFAALRRF
jgi:hypothetical protein